MTITWVAEFLMFVVGIEMILLLVSICGVTLKQSAYSETSNCYVIELLIGLCISHNQL
jgi:hypothetical protein